MSTEVLNVLVSFTPADKGAAEASSQEQKRCGDPANVEWGSKLTLQKVKKQKFIRIIVDICGGRADWY